ncbi:hypothetical protein ACLK1S_23520 [Escherichia coli]
MAQERVGCVFATRGD